MLKVFVSNLDHQDCQDVIQKIRSLTLAHSTTVDSSIRTIQLIHDHQSYEGKEVILQYLDTFEEYLKDWYKCHCG